MNGGESAVAGADRPAPAAEKRTSYVELFFDLVFVFAITQLADLLQHRHDAAGWAHALLLLWLVWWAWSLYTWAGNAIDVDVRWVCLSLLAITGCTLFMAQFIPTAFGDRGRQFAVAYTLVRLAGLALYWAGLRDRAGERAALWTFLPYSALGAVLVLVGGFVPVGGRPWVWLVAAAVDASSTFAAGRGEFHVQPAHFAERHALFVIIALGESIVSVGVAGSRDDLDPTAVRYLAAAAAIVVIASLWWAYFDWLREASERKLEQTPQTSRGRLARDLYTLGHVPIVAGTVVFAVGVEDAVAQPLQPFTSFGRWAIGGGIVMYLLGFVFAHARANHALLLERLVGAVLVGVFVGVAGRRVDAVWVLVVLAAINVALSSNEALQAHRLRARHLAHPH